MPTIDLTELLPAEQRLLDAAIAGEPCDLINPDARPTHDEIVTWNDHKREIRAEFFARLITNQFDGYKIAKVEVRGAVISGDLDLTGPIDVIDVRSEYSRYQALTAHRATFTGDAAFVGSTFAGSVWFSKSTFTRDAAFAWSTFTEEVGFAQSTFTGDAWFARSTFAGDSAR